MAQRHVSVMKYEPSATDTSSSNLSTPMQCYIHTQETSPEFSSEQFLSNETIPRHAANRTCHSLIAFPPIPVYALRRHPAVGSSKI